MKLLYPSHKHSEMLPLKAGTVLKVFLAGTLILSTLFFLQQSTGHKKNLQGKTYWFPFVKPDFNAYITLCNNIQQGIDPVAGHDISILV